jgi:hypothetical protein
MERGMRLRMARRVRTMRRARRVRRRRMRRMRVRGEKEEKRMGGGEVRYHVGVRLRTHNEKGDRQTKESCSKIFKFM